MFIYIYLSICQIIPPSQIQTAKATQYTHFQRCFLFVLSPVLTMPMAILFCTIPHANNVFVDDGCHCILCIYISSDSLDSQYISTAQCVCEQSKTKYFVKGSSILFAFRKQRISCANNSSFVIGRYSMHLYCHFFVSGTKRRTFLLSNSNRVLRTGSSATKPNSNHTHHLATFHHTQTHIRSLSHAELNWPTQPNNH